MDRCRSLEEATCSSLVLQAEVHQLILAVRAEAAAMISAAGVPLSGSAVAVPPSPCNLVKWAAGFYKHAPPSIAAALQEFLVLQNAGFGGLPSPVAVVGTSGACGGLVAMEASDDEAAEAGGDDVLIALLAGAAFTTARASGASGPAAAGQPAVLAAASSRSTGAFGRQRDHKGARIGPYLGALEAGAEIAAAAQAALADVGDGSLHVAAGNVVEVTG